MLSKDEAELLLSGPAYAPLDCWGTTEHGP